MLFRKDTTREEKIIMALAAFGAAAMGYLLKVHFSHGAGGSVCDFGASFNCQIVNQSMYAELLGVPVSAMGFAFFVAVFLAARARPRHVFAALQLATVASLVFGVYLSVIEARVLYTYCLFCEASKLAMLGIVWAAAVAGRKAGERVPAWMYMCALVAGGFGTAIAWWLQQSY